MIGWLGGRWHPQPISVQILDLTLWFLIKTKYSSVKGDVPVDSEASVVTSSISRPVGLVLRRSVLEVLIGVGCVCVHRGECMRVYVSVCVCTIFLKKKKANMA
jgi:hypothetical protein